MPLAVHARSARASPRARVAAPVGLVDVAPTVLSLLGIGAGADARAAISARCSRRATAAGVPTASWRRSSPRSRTRGWWSTGPDKLMCDLRGRRVPTLRFARKDPGEQHRTASTSRRRPRCGRGSTRGWPPRRASKSGGTGAPIRRAVKRALDARPPRRSRRHPRAGGRCSSPEPSCAAKRRSCWPCCRPIRRRGARSKRRRATRAAPLGRPGAGPPGRRRARKRGGRLIAGVCARRRRRLCARAALLSATSLLRRAGPRRPLERCEWSSGAPGQPRPRALDPSDRPGAAHRLDWSRARRARRSRAAERCVAAPEPYIPVRAAWPRCSRQLRAFPRRADRCLLARPARAPTCAALRAALARGAGLTSLGPAVRSGAPRGARSSRSPASAQRHRRRRRLARRARDGTAASTRRAPWSRA